MLDDRAYSTPPTSGVNRDGFGEYVGAVFHSDMSTGAKALAVAVCWATIHRADTLSNDELMSLISARSERHLRDLKREVAGSGFVRIVPGNGRGVPSRYYPVLPISHDGKEAQNAPLSPRPVLKEAQNAPLSGRKEAQNAPLSPLKEAQNDPLSGFSPPSVSPPYNPPLPSPPPLQDAGHEVNCTSNSSSSNSKEKGLPGVCSKDTPPSPLADLGPLAGRMLGEVGRWYNNYVPDTLAATVLLEGLVLAHGVPAVMQGYTDLLARIADGSERHGLPQRLSRYAGEAARQHRAKALGAAPLKGRMKRLRTINGEEMIFVRDGESDVSAILRSQREYEAGLERRYAQ